MKIVALTFSIQHESNAIKKTIFKQWYIKNMFDHYLGPYLYFQHKISTSILAITLTNTINIITFHQSK